MFDKLKNKIECTSVYDKPIINDLNKDIISPKIDDLKDAVKLSINNNDQKTEE